MNQFYDVKPIIKIAAKEKSPTIIVVGGKGNGKTYGFLEFFLDDYLKSGKYLRYVRRYRESITAKAIQSLLLPQKKNIAILSGGKYNSYYYYRNRFYLTKEDIHGNRVAKDNNAFIVCSALNSTESFTGADEGLCSAIIFDEFLSRERTLDDEFTSLMILHNNTLRNRTDIYTPLILIGNTFTRNSPLAKEFGVDMYKIQQGDINIVKNKNNDVLCVVEYCKPTEKMQRAGKTIYSRYDTPKVKMMYTGDWTIGNYPRIQNRYIQASDKIFTALVKTTKNLIIEYRMYKLFLFCYVREYKQDNFDCILTLDNTPTQYNIFSSFDNKKQFFRLLSDAALNKKIYFDSGETGELFKDFFTNFTGGKIISNLYL